jgi:imidazolonepropionase-like amidohydrolase
MRSGRFVFLLIFAGVCLGAAAQTTTSSYTLHKFARAIGKESDTLTVDSSGYKLTSDFLFTDRGTKVPLQTQYTADAKLRPLALSARGKVSRTSALNLTIQVNGATAAISENGTSSTASAPPVVFATAGYAPAAMQELLMRTWFAAGQPASLPLLPQGDVRITAAGPLQVDLAGKKEMLDGYTVSGLIWGVESLWLNADHQLVALISTDAEFDHFEAVRDGYESQLGTLIGAAVQSDMAALDKLALLARAPVAAKLAIEGATLIDVTGGPSIPDSIVLTSGDKIIAVGPRAQVKVPADATVLDAHGKYLIPGLWDMHAHYEQVEWGPIYLASGVTSVRDVGNEFAFITTVRDALNSGHGIGPEIFFAGIIDGNGPRAMGAVNADTPDEARAQVQRYKNAGASQIKIYSSVKPEVVAAICTEAHRLGMTVTGHIPDGMNAMQGVNAGMDQINHVQYVLPLFEKDRLLRALFHIFAVPCVVLVLGALVISRLLRRGGWPKRSWLRRTLAGFAAFVLAVGYLAATTWSHDISMDPGIAPEMDFTSPEAKQKLQFFVDHHTVVDPTVALMELWTTPTGRPVRSFEPGIAKVAPQLRAALDQSPVSARFAAQEQWYFNSLLQTVAALHKAGVPIVAGTDQAIPGYSLHREIELYVKAGFTPMEALQSATLVPARVLRAEDRVGSIAPGKRADLLLLNGDPLADIANTRKVYKTIAAGAVYDPAPLWASVDFQP